MAGGGSLRDGARARAQDDALGRAYRFLGRRDRTEAELRAHLAARDVDERLIDETIAELRDQGYLDDAAYARRFVEDRRALDGWGRERIERRLEQAGVGRELVDAALARDPGAELADAVAVLRRRVGAPPDDDRGRERALGVLVRRGYELEVAHDAVRAFERGDGPADG